MGETVTHWMSAIEVGERLADGDLSSVEVTEVMLERIGRLDPYLGSFDQVTAEQALLDAAAADAELQRGVRRSALHGVPVAVKALADLAGVPTAAGTVIRAGHVPDRDATVVSRLRGAGAVILGLLTMTEGASAVHHPSIEQPRNPWDQAAWAGVSSSGSGVATAAGLTFASLGSDTGGSIRAPSHFCGVVGLKPTFGRVSRAGVFPLSATLDHVGPMTRTVADGAAVLGVIAGPDERDLTTSLVEVPDYLSGLDGSLDGYRIGWDERYATDGVDRELAAAIVAARRVLEAEGARIVPVTVPPLQPAMDAGARILHADVALAHEGSFDAHRASYGPHLAQIIEIGRTLTGVELSQAHEWRRQWIGGLDAMLATVDALLCPPTGAPAPPARLTGGITGDFRTQGQVFKYTLPFNLSGHPALTVPAGFTEGGLPVAFQLIGRRFDESSLLRAGHRYQQATDWRTVHPPDPS